MDHLGDFYADRASRDRLAELRREADAYRLTRTLAERHATLFPGARRFAAGLTGLGGSRRRTTDPGVAAPTSSLQPCGC